MLLWVVAFDIDMVPISECESRMKYRENPVNLKMPMEET